MVGRHQAVNLGRGGHVIFFIQDAAPFEFGQHAVIHTGPTVVLDVDIAGGNELLRTGTEEHANSSDDRLHWPALVAEGDDHGAPRRQMALVNRAGDMLLQAEKSEIHGGVGILHRGVPFIGPSHGDGHGISRLDANVQVSASGFGMINAAGVQAGGLHGDGFGVGGSPVENAIILRVRSDGQGADE